MKKFLSVILTLSLIFTLTIPALAVEPTEEDYAAYDAAFDAAYGPAFAQGYDQGLKDAAAGVITYDGEYTMSDGFSAAEGTHDGQLLGYDAGYSEAWTEITGRDVNVDRVLLSMGGVPGQVNVQIDGDMIAFPDAIPQIVNSRTMIPARVILEELGQLVTWDPAAYTVTISDPVVERHIVLTIGSTSAVVIEGENQRTETLDAAPYIDENNRTIVPLRFLSETCGYTVLWDDEYRTAVVMDMNAKIGEIDAQFTHINDILAQVMTQQKSQNVKQTVDLSGSLAFPVEEGGPMTTLPMSAKATAWTNGTAVKMELSLNLLELIDGLQALDPTIFDGIGLNLSTILSTDWENVAATLLMTQEGKMYFHCPLLNTIGEAPANTWFDLLALTGTPEIPDLGEMPMTEVFTMGELVTAMAVQSAQPIYAAESLDMSVELLTALFGDVNAKAKGDGYTWTFSKQLSDLEPGAVGGILGHMTLSPSGAYDMDFTLDMGEDGAMTILGSGTDTKGTLSLSLNIPGVMVLAFDMNQTVTFTNTLPAFTLPADAVVEPAA